MVLTKSVINRRYEVEWLCRCDCGTERSVMAWSIRSGKTLSCGCLRKERATASNTKHGLCSKGSSENYLYNAYNAARRRCADNPYSPNFEKYRGRGITFEFSSLEEFVAELGPRPTPEHSVDRIDNELGYRPGNIRWATKSLQLVDQRPRRQTKYPYRGIVQQPNGRWRAACRFNNKTHYLGSYPTAEEAARAYDLKARELHGETAKLNFPPKKQPASITFDDLKEDVA